MRHALRACLVATLFALVALAPTPALACSCRPFGLAEAFARNSVVFLGRVESIESFEATDLRVAAFASARTFKGPAQNQHVVKTRAHAATCGFPFQIGETYLVFATRDETEALKVHRCSRTALVEDAAGDVAELLGGAPPDSKLARELRGAALRRARLAPINFSPGRAACANASSGESPPLSPLLALLGAAVLVVARQWRRAQAGPRRA
jgi:MYXO-CTERM domain-containing protein